MEYSTLGNTDLKVSKICLGTMTWGDQNTEAQGHEQLDYAVDQGINFIDTAELYAVPPKEETQGSTETILGNWLKKRGKRDDLIIASKITGPGAHVKYIRENTTFSRDEIFGAIEKTLQRLQTDYIDLYQLHWPARKTNFFGKLGYIHDDNDPWEDNFLGVLDAMHTLVHQGKIRHFGISNETPWALSRFLQLADTHKLPRCQSVQNPYSLLNRTYEIGLAEMSIREKSGLLAYSPLAFGRLTDKFIKGKDTPNCRINKFSQLSRYNGALSIAAAKQYYEIAEKFGLNFAQMSLAFVNDRPFVTSNIIGATTMDQLKENIGSINLKLSAEVLEEIEKVHLAIPNPAP
ncbi:MAG: NADP(H)-dependent aldo-keto reductase [Cyclobacteriaceae bacterium]|nr:NADP(H)-dependent aldo-keto reductase [Cyclobacteriaceae bacterium]